jgi:hypothetical protein
MLYPPAVAWDQTLHGGAQVGENTSSGFDPTFLFRAGVWTDITPVIAGSAATRGNLGPTEDSADGNLVLFGGDTPPPNFAYRSDIWAFVEPPRLSSSSGGPRRLR